MSEWENRSSSYRRGYVAGQQRDVYFARLVEGATDQAEAMQGYADGLADVNDADERKRFEEWVTKACGGTAYTFRQRDGRYSNTWVADSWEAWQAALTFGSNHGDAPSDGRDDNCAGRRG